MAAHALGIPTYQTKSNRNLFADAPVAPAEKDEEIVFTSDLAGIEISPVPSSSPSSSPTKPNESTSPTKRTKSKSPKKRSPFKNFVKSPVKSPAKSPTRNDGNEAGFFAKLYYSLAGYNANGVYRPAPVAKGVHFDSRKNDVPLNSVKTIDTAETLDEKVFEWVASNLDDHTRGVPGVVRRPEYEKYDEPDDKKLLKKLMTYAKKLPQEPGKYASVHIMVNAERAKRMIPPLRRERYMDQIAREQAKLMAEEQNLFHIDSPNELRKRLKELDRESRELPDFMRVGTNVGRGKDIAEAHRFMMAALAERNNIHDKRFFYMGIGTWIAESGQIYMCQVFGG